jgi:hypothetical protein
MCVRRQFSFELPDIIGICVDAQGLLRTSSLLYVYVSLSEVFLSPFSPASLKKFTVRSRKCIMSVWRVVTNWRARTYIGWASLLVSVTFFVREMIWHVAYRRGLDGISKKGVGMSKCVCVGSHEAIVSYVIHLLTCSAAFFFFFSFKKKEFFLKEPLMNTSSMNFIFSAWY